MAVTETTANMKPFTNAKTALIIIDVQNGFKHPTHWGASRNNPDCEANIARLLEAARKQNKNTTAINDSERIQICHVHHHSTNKDSLLYPGAKLEVAGGEQLDAVAPQDEARPEPGESVFIKDVNSSFIGTELEPFLRSRGVRQLVIVGLTTDHCVSTTTRMASNLGVTAKRDEKTGDLEDGDIVLVSDACATFSKGAFDAETVHRVNLASLDGEFAQVAGTSEVLETVFIVS